MKPRYRSTAPMPKRLLLITACLLPVLAEADALTIAVASNFLTTAEELIEEFTSGTGHEVRISAGSTGKLYAQISNGAPYDVFLAADSERPALLEENQLVVPGSRITYAIGSLVLWSRDAKFEGGDCRKHLEDLGQDRLAIANPDTAPYGTAAREFLLASGLWIRVQPRLVFGENISQTLQFVASGNAAIGLIAGSQSIDPRLPVATCSWPVPQAMHHALEQQAVILERATNKVIAAKFIAYLASPAAQAIVIRHGYRVPQ